MRLGVDVRQGDMHAPGPAVAVLVGGHLGGVLSGVQSREAPLKDPQGYQQAPKKGNLKETQF